MYKVDMSCFTNKAIVIVTGHNNIGNTLLRFNTDSVVDVKQASKKPQAVCLKE